MLEEELSIYLAHFSSSRTSWRVHVGNKPSESVRRAFSKKKIIKPAISLGDLPANWLYEPCPSSLPAHGPVIVTFKRFPLSGDGITHCKTTLYIIFSHRAAFPEGSVWSRWKRPGESTAAEQGGNPARPGCSSPSILPPQRHFWVFQAAVPWESEGDGREGAHGWSWVIKSGMCGKPRWGENGGLPALGSRKPRPGAEVEPGCSLQAGRETQAF